MSKPDVRSNVWRVVSDGDFPMIVHAEDFAEVMSFVGYNASELMGAPTMAHVNLQIDQLWESEVEAMYDAVRRMAADTSHLGKILGANGEPFDDILSEQELDVVEELFNKTETVDLDNGEVRF